MFSQNIRSCWEALQTDPNLVVFSALDAQKVWQRYFADKGNVRFTGHPDYIQFMQAFMMAGAEEKWITESLFAAYRATFLPSSPFDVSKKIARAIAINRVKLMSDLKNLVNAQVHVMFVNVTKYSAPSALWEDMKNGEPIRPSDM